MSDKILIFKDTNGNEYAIKAKEKVFTTGSRGYYISGKIEMDGKRFQLGGNLVEIGSKPKQKEGVTEQ